MDNVEVIEISDTLVESNNPCPNIYPRFKKVRESLMDSVYGCPTPDIHKDFKSTYWPEGIIDHRGSIEGIKNGIRLSFKARGTTVSRQPYVDINEEGELVSRIRKEEYICLDGHFISKDGLEGAIEIVANDGQIIFEGYWLENLDGDLVLEQVVDINGNVHTLEEIEDMPINRIYVCKSRKESDHVYSLGGTARQIFHEGIDKPGRLEEMQKNREFQIPGIDGRISMIKKTRLKRSI
ncbi:MAG: hypothetical protein WCY37_01715 [Candidatus Dojkabacteria bacterium]|jgi:hypothetical protein